MQFTKQEILWIKSQYQDVSDLSFFAGLDGTPAQEPPQSLVEKGVVKEQDIDDAMKKVFDVLAYSQRRADVKVGGRGLDMVKTAFASGTLTILIEPMGQEYMVGVYDQEAPSVQQELIAHLGMGITKTSQVKCQLEGPETLMLLHIIDFIRKHCLLNRVDGSKITDINKDAFDHYVMSPIKNSLARFLSATYQETMPDYDRAQTALRGLVSMGLITTSEDQWLVDSSVNAFASGFIAPDTQIVLELRDGSKEGPVVVASSVILQAGIKDILSITPSVDGFDLETLTGSELIARIDAYLRCPALQ